MNYDITLVYIVFVLMIILVGLFGWLTFRIEKVVSHTDSKERRLSKEYFKEIQVGGFYNGNVLFIVPEEEAPVVRSILQDYRDSTNINFAGEEKDPAHFHIGKDGTIRSDSSNRNLVWGTGNNILRGSDSPPKGPVVHHTSEFDSYDEDWGFKNENKIREDLGEKPLSEKEYLDNRGRPIKNNSHHFGIENLNPTLLKDSGTKLKTVEDEPVGVNPVTDRFKGKNIENPVKKIPFEDSLSENLNKGIAELEKKTLEAAKNGDAEFVKKALVDLDWLETAGIHFEDGGSLYDFQ